MSTLNFIITDAGRQAAINADAMGVQLTLTEVGYGTGNWSPDKTATALQSEFKRLPAGGGDNPAPLYVHIAVTDQSSDTYQGNEVAVYAGNVLFAIWSKGLQPDTDGPGKISSGDSAFVFDLLLDNVPPGSVTVGDANFSVPLSTETKPGIISEASQIEINGYSGVGAIIPPKLKVWWDSVKVAFALKQHDHDLSEINEVGSAAKLNAGDSAGEVALIGNPSSDGRTAVVVASGSNANGYYRIWSDGYKEQWGEVVETYKRSFPVSFSNFSSINLTASWNSSPNSASGAASTCIVLNASEFGVAVGGTTTTNRLYWTAKGY